MGMIGENFLSLMEKTSSYVQIASNLVATFANLISDLSVIISEYAEPRFRPSLIKTALNHVKAVGRYDSGRKITEKRVLTGLSKALWWVFRGDEFWVPAGIFFECSLHIQYDYWTAGWTLHDYQ